MSCICYGLELNEDFLDILEIYLKIWRYGVDITFQQVLYIKGIRKLKVACLKIKRPGHAFIRNTIVRKKMESTSAPVKAFWIRPQ